MSHFLSFVLICLVSDCVVGPVFSNNSSLSRLPKEIVHKIANDYVANQAHLVHFSQINREYRAIADQVDLQRINQDYASIINTTMNASQIFSTFYNLKRVKTIKEFANTRLPCIFRGGLSYTTGQGAQNLAYLAFMMRDIDKLYYMEMLRVLIFVFVEGKIIDMLLVNACDRVPSFVEQYKLESQGNYTKIFEAIMNGSKVMDELILFNKPWTRETAKLYGRTFAIVAPAPFGVLLLYFQEVALQPSVITMYLGLIICITTAIILMNVYVIRMRRG